ncbi:hypothetical protein ABZ840_01875 [Streptomyces sp. NPDC047117]
MPYAQLTALLIEALKEHDTALRALSATVATLTDISSRTTDGS